MKHAASPVFLVLLALLLAPAAGAQIVVDHTTVDDTRIPQAHLDSVRNLDIFFVHASVGMGMVAGLRSLSNANPTRYALTLGGLGTPASWFDNNNGLIENGDWAGKGGNGNPLGKIQGFDELIRNQGYGTRADIAFMKFCYIDFMQNTNVTQVWTSYRDTMAALETAYPKVTFVWFTAALNSLGTEGKIRAEFNKYVRDYCRSQGKTLFDLAAIESHDPDGNPARDDHGNETIYAGYTDDNGHLAAAGRDRVARTLWWLFARVAGWKVAPTALKATAGTPVLAADGAATAEVTVKLHDGTNDMFVSGPDQAVTFGLTGPGTLVGPNPVTTAGGEARITLRAGTITGKARIVATAPGLTAGQTEIDLIANRAPNAPTGLQCAGQTNPTALPHGHPDLTWSFDDPDAAAGDRQSAWRVIVADNPTDIAKDVGNVWDSGKVASREARANPCVVPLRPGIRYHWKAKTWDASDREGPFSPAATLQLANRTGFAARVDAAAGRVDLGQGASLDVNGANAGGLTVEMWLYRTVSGQESVLCERFHPDVGGYRVSIDAADHVCFRTRGAKDRRATALGVKIAKGTWHHIACQTAGAAGTIYVDGIQQGRNGLISMPGALGSATARLETAGALVAELRISDVERYAGNFTPPTAPFAPDANTRGLWHFDEGQGWSAADASGHANTATLDPTANWGAGRFTGPAFQPPLLFHTGRPSPGHTLHLEMVGRPNDPVILGISVHPRPLDPPVVLPGYGNFCLGWPLALLPLGAVPSHGVTTLSLALPAALPAPATFPAQALVGSRLTDCVVIDVRP